MKKLASLKGHNQRVLYLATNWQGDVVVSGAGDETLRFWNLGYDTKKMTKENVTKEKNMFLQLLR